MNKEEAERKGDGSDETQPRAARGTSVVEALVFGRNGQQGIERRQVVGQEAGGARLQPEGSYFIRFTSTA